jgi:hypothetical protein
MLLTKGRKKMLADANKLMGHIFQITPEGDGKMNAHIAMCALLQLGQMDAMKILRMALRVLMWPSSTH